MIKNWATIVLASIGFITGTFTLSPTLLIVGIAIFTNEQRPSEIIKKLNDLLISITPKDKIIPKILKIKNEE